jgi:putative phage-type endonuclease
MFSGGFFICRNSVMKSHAKTTSTHPSALRLVSTRNMPRSEWLRIRKQGIGASDAAAAVGLSPYQSPLELWLIKTGRDAQLPKLDADDDNSPLYWGHALEPIVAEHYSKRTGNKVRRVNAVLQHSDADKAWMLANLDYAVVGCSDVQILECKTAGEFGARLWRDGVPAYVQCKVQHQLAVTGKVAADVCVLICGQEIRVHRIHRDDKLIERLIELERTFWHYVETDTPPPADGSKSAGRALQCLYPRDNSEVLDLSGDEAMAAVFNHMLTARNDLRVLGETESELKQQIQERMGSASKALFAGGDVSWKRSKDSTALDVGAVLKENPELLDRFPLTRPGSRRFLVQTNQ